MNVNTSVLLHLSLLPGIGPCTILKIVKALTDSPFLDFKRQDVEAMLQAAGVDQNTRGETIGLDQFVVLAKQVSSGPMPLS